MYIYIYNWKKLNNPLFSYYRFILANKRNQRFQTRSFFFNYKDILSMDSYLLKKDMGVGTKSEFQQRLK